MNKKRLKKLVKELIPYAIVILVVVIIRTFFITPAIVDGKSMYPTLDNNNVVILNKIDYRLSDINRFDVVVIKLEKEKLIKRVIGLPGEHVEYKDGNLYVDGFMVDEDFNHADTNDFKLESIGYLKIPGDKYFVVGDNRMNSTDSRVIGLIDKENILGSVSYRIFPINKIGNVK